MPKTLIILGAGPGTGRSIAERYAREGFNVALVARRPDALQALSSEVQAALQAEGRAADVRPFIADLTDASALRAALDRVRQELGSIDVLAYTAAPTGGFTAAAELEVAQLRAFDELSFYPLVGAVQHVLGDLKASERGGVLYVNGASVLGAPAGMSGPAPAGAAARNYLMTLREELAGDDVFVGAAFVAALIKNSAIQAEAAKWDPEGQVPTIDPAEIAESLWQRHSRAGDFEVVLPFS